MYQFSLSENLLFTFSRKPTIPILPTLSQFLSWKLARAFGASRSDYSVDFWGFYPFQIFIVPWYPAMHAITKSTNEPTCGKSRFYRAYPAS